jgi:hypothetical protein
MPASMTTMEASSTQQWQEVWELLPDRSIVVLLLRIVVGCVAAVPLVYYGVNQTSVPPMNSMDIIRDDYTRTQLPPHTMFAEHAIGDMTRYVLPLDID